MGVQWLGVSGSLQCGHRVASGMAEDSPYPKGTIEMQIPFFQQRGLDLSSFFFGTLNISINPYFFKIEKPEYTFRNVKWHTDFAAEDFSFSHCRVIFDRKIREGLIYYPHPETKIGHFQDNSTLEVIAEYIERVSYGDRVDIEVNPTEISIHLP